MKKIKFFFCSVQLVVYKTYVSKVIISKSVISFQAVIKYPHKIMPNDKAFQKYGREHKSENPLRLKHYSNTSNCSF